MISQLLFAVKAILVTSAFIIVIYIAANLSSNWENAPSKDKSKKRKGNLKGKIRRGDDKK